MLPSCAVQPVKTGQHQLRALLPGHTRDAEGERYVLCLRIGGHALRSGLPSSCTRVLVWRNATRTNLLVTVRAHEVRVDRSRFMVAIGSVRISS